MNSKLTHCLEQEQICDKINPPEGVILFLSSTQVRFLDQHQVLE